MKRFLRISLQVLIWGALVAYCVIATRHCRGEQKKEVLREVAIEIKDSASVVTQELVCEWLSNIPLEGETLEKIDGRQIIDTLLAHPFVSDAEAYVEQSGRLNISVGQRRPVVRVVRTGGEDIYLSEDLVAMPVGMIAPQDVPIVTGMTPEEEKNLQFAAKLIKFVELLEVDPLWHDEVMQIMVGRPEVPWGEPVIYLFVQSGRFTVKLGELGSEEEVKDRMEKLALMYRNVLPWEGWDTYAVLDASYEGQVVAKK